MTAAAAFEARGKKLRRRQAAGRAAASGRDHRLGREPDHHGPALRRALGADLRRRTGRWSATASASTGRSGCGTSTSATAGTATRAASASATTRRARSAPRSPTAPRAASASRSRRRRPHVRAWYAVDGGASPHPDPLCHAQQPRLSPGIHVSCRRCANRRAAASRTRISARR